MAADKIRLGGMALPNGVLVHGPTSWGCAVRLSDGTIKVASANKRVFGAGVTNPLLRGPLKLLDAFAVLPQVKRAMPEAKLPFERPGVIGAMLASTVAVRAVRTNAELRPLVRELASGFLSLAPALAALRGGELAAYHGAEHVSIGTYEHGERRPKEHERCGSHLVGPLLATTAVGNVLASRAPEQLRGPARAVAAVGAAAASVELFGWMSRHPDTALAKALRRPGYELQARVATAEPSEAQLEVAQAALDACLAEEQGHGRAR
jgi:uncharacterized protein YqhQ